MSRFSRRKRTPKPFTSELRQQILVRTAPRRFTQQIEITESSGECEVQPVADGGFVPPKRQSLRRATQIRLVWLKGSRQAANVFAVARIHNVQVLGDECRAVERSCKTADDDKLHTGTGERGQRLLEVRDHGLATGLRDERTKSCDEARGVDELLRALLGAQSEIFLHESEINVPFENFKHRIERFRRRAWHSGAGFWGVVKLVRLHGRSLKPLPFTRNDRFNE